MFFKTWRRNIIEYVTFLRRLIEVHFRIIITVCTLLSPTVLKSFIELYQIHFPTVDSHNGISWARNSFVTGDPVKNPPSPVWIYTDRIKNCILDFTNLMVESDISVWCEVIFHSL